MRRPFTPARAALVALGFLAVSAGGCAIGDGQGWATLEVATSAGLGAGAADLTTDLDYDVAITSLTAAVHGVELLEMAGGGGGGDATFDPANPPPGYTLCHGGHCHAADGALVSYEDIEAELAGGGAAAPTVVDRLDVEATLAFGEDAGPTLGPFETDTVSLAAAGLVLRDIRLEGTVVVDDETVPLVVHLADGADLSVRGAVSGTIGRGGRSDARLRIAVSLPADWLDGVRFTNLERADGAIRIGHESNHTVAELLAGRLAATAADVELGDRG